MQQFSVWEWLQFVVQLDPAHIRDVHSECLDLCQKRSRAIGIGGKLKNPVVPRSAWSNPLIYNERRAPASPQNATILAESATVPSCPLSLHLSNFSFEIKEKEGGEIAGKARATVWKGCLFLNHGLEACHPLILWHFVGGKFVVA
ncbi:hypothetical protein [Ralstonia solanacearum]|uniref:hypothetical protein n=1 Tax=Ralstonia solanacearum TaxID=305 RepID=UPI00168BD3D7|nr:hypothetical protein [Ralstonia solanacearum]QNT25973.1 hypothetical protein C2I38_028150 [Ralstonia solanacearum]QNT63555.1 hypothetical protein C2L97_28045 [Ralstonia solanacearum]